MATTQINVNPLLVPDQILRLPEVRQKTGLGTTKIYERMNRGEFPQSIPLGERTVGWSSNEIDAWIESRKALRPTRAAA